MHLWSARHSQHHSPGTPSSSPLRYGEYGAPYSFYLSRYLYHMDSLLSIAFFGCQPIPFAKRVVV
jgi:hypothetical protein